MSTPTTTPLAGWRTRLSVFTAAAFTAIAAIAQTSTTTTLSLGDIVGGGNGTGNGAYKTGISARDGSTASTLWAGQGQGLGFRAPASGNPNINGVFIPNGSTVINTLGARFAFPASSGNSWDAIRNGVGTLETNQDVNPIYDLSGNITTVGVGMHANSGITFDLVEMAKVSAGTVARTFSGSVGGIPNPTRCGTGDAIAHILVDGVSVFSARVGMTTAAATPFAVNLPAGARFLTLAITDGGNGDSCDKAYFANAKVDLAPVTVYASGISPVIAWDPIFPSGPVNPDSAESKPVPTVGYDDPRWVNPHSATVFAKNSHPWEYDSSVPSSFKFDANWINAWGNLNSDGHGKNINWTYWVYYAGWYPWYQTTSRAFQSWTKYSTVVYGSGSYVLQFFADNASWIYLNGELVGFQDYHWSTNGSGRYTIQLNGNGPHELSWIIWDGGGLAGGKFRLETVQSFVNNNPGTPLPPPPPSADKTAPVITAPASITTEATSSAGATVTFTATATDETDGPVPVVAVPASGSTFAIGTTPVGLAASDAAGNTASASFDVTVQDTTAPSIGIATNVGPIEATSADGAMVSFSVPSATDIVDGSVTVIATPASGSTFVIGTTQVTLSATDSRGNASSRTFQVNVADTKAPAITAPADITAEATSAAGATVSYSASAMDIVDGNVAVSGSPASGATFAIGITPVALSAIDSRGNAGSASFNVKVQDTTAPSLVVPASQILEATSAAGAVATFAPSATDAVGVTSLTTSSASGSTFAIGTTTVAVTAKDAAGNTSSGSFTISVIDTTAPVLTVPANQVLEATSAAGAVANFAASATDAVGVTLLTTSAASGSTFPIGVTSVTATAKDAAGNSTSGSFTVTVRDTTAPTITSVTPSLGVLWPANHKMVALSLGVAASDIVGLSSVKIVKVTSSEPDNGLGDGDTAGDIVITGDLTLQLRAERSGRGDGRTYTITVEARDAAGNATTATTTVSVPKSMAR